MFPFPNPQQAAAAAAANMWMNPYTNDDPGYFFFL